MKKKIIAYAILIVVLGLIIYSLISYFTKPGKYDDFARCLTEKGVIMYGTDWCPHCQEQKAKFGKSFKYVDYKDCDLNKDLCTKKGIEGYPTWIINNKKYPGTKSLDYLASLSGCEVKA